MGENYKMKENKEMKKNLGFQTRCVRIKPSKGEGAHTFPIYQTAGFVFENAEEGAKRFTSRFAGVDSGYIYTRFGNPTVRVFEEKIAELEDGEDALAFPSGMGAITVTILSLAKKGDHVISTDVVYGGTHKLFDSILPEYGIEFSLIDTSDIDVVKKSVKDNTKAIFIETPTNPTMKVSDIKAIAEIAKNNNIILVVDNTFLTPYFQMPLKLGADIVIHSATKYIAGHNNATGGVAIGSKSFTEKAFILRKNMGVILSPFDAWIMTIGVKTLPLRMEKHNENAMKIAKFLEKHEKIEKVLYPGLASHPQYETSKKQSTGSGGMLAFEIKGGIEAGKKLIDNVELCVLEGNLGDVCTLIQHPASMTHAVIPKEERLKIGITDGMVRLSVGIEDADDIINDLEQALKKV